MTYIYYFVIIAGKWNCYGKHTDWNRPPWPGTIATICMSCFMTGGPGKEHRTNNPLPTTRVQKRSKRHHMCDHLPESLASILAEQGVHHWKDFESEWLAKDNPEINPIN